MLPSIVKVTTETKSLVLVIIKSTPVVLLLDFVNKHYFFHEKSSSTLHSLHLKKGKLNGLQKFLRYFGGIVLSPGFPGCGDWGGFDEVFTITLILISNDLSSEALSLT